jgi:hypothetical protein
MKYILAGISVSLGLAVYGQEWQTTYYIWNFGLISSCDKGIIDNPVMYFLNGARCDGSEYKNIGTGDIVWITCRFASYFVTHIVPTLNCPIVVVVADGDESFPSDCGDMFDVEAFLSHEFIAHVFAQNNDYKGYQKNITSIPIGLDFHTVAYKGTQGGWGEHGSVAQQEAQLHEILATLQPTYARKRRAFVDFHLSDTMHGELQRYLQFKEDRRSIFEQLVKADVVDYRSFMRRSELWRTKGNYAFSISPHGNGLDCHRTWEDLVLGCIVIVKTSPLDCLYEGLPVVIVQDWSEVTHQNMQKWLIQYGDAFTNQKYRQKLTHEYWWNKIQEKVTDCKEGIRA